MNGLDNFLVDGRRSDRFRRPVFAPPPPSELQRYVQQHIHPLLETTVVGVFILAVLMHRIVEPQIAKRKHYFVERIAYCGNAILIFSFIQPSQRIKRRHV